VSVLEINCAAKVATLNNMSFPCRIGRDGYVAQSHGREGDGKTPLGNYVLRFGLYRADRLPAPRSSLTFRALQRSL